MSKHFITIIGILSLLVRATAFAAVPTAPTIDHPREYDTYPGHYKYDLEVQSDDVGFVGELTHLHSDWELRTATGGDGTLLDSSYDDSTNKTSWTIDNTKLGGTDTLYIRHRHANADGDSAWTETEFTTIGNGLVTGLPPYLLQNGYQHNEFVEKGLIPVTLYDNYNGSDRCADTGLVDCKNVINHVIQVAQDFSMSVFFDTGTYLTSGMITGRQTTTVSTTQTVNLIGSYAGAQPTILLANNAADVTVLDRSVEYDNTSNPNPVIWMWNKHPSCTSEPCVEYNGNLFASTIRNIKVDVGDSNPGACGVFHPGAQGSSMSDVTVDATGGFCGFWGGLPNVGGGSVNLTVTGGRYGIYFDQGRRPTSMTNVTLTGQTTAAVRLEDVYSAVFTGLKIEIPAAPAIIIEQNYGNGSGSLVIHDGRIEITGASGGTIINNTEGQAVYLNNVYMKGPAGQVLNAIQSGAESAIALDSTGNWHTVDEYFYNDQKSEGWKGSVFNAWNLIDGVRTQTAEPISSPTSLDSGAPPSNLQSKHSWGTLPDFEDGDVQDVVNDLGVDNTGHTDVTAALQAAIKGNDKLFFPRGKYTISAPLLLDDGTYFMGLTNSSVDIRPISTWLPTSQTYLLITVDDSDASVFIGDLNLRWEHRYYDNDYFGVLRHQAGAGSVIRNLFDKYISWIKDPNGLIAKPHLRYYFTNNAAGKVYGWSSFYADRTKNEDMHSLMIENCDGPLIFYDFNPEHYQCPSATSGCYSVGIKNSSNIKIYAVKDEHGKRQWLQIEDSTNIAIYGYNGQNNAYGKVLKAVSTTPDASDNLLFAIISPQYESSDYMYVEDNTGTDYYINGSEHIGLYKKGTFVDFGMCVPATPTISDPSASETNVEVAREVNSSAYADQSGCTTTHVSSDWEICSDTNCYSVTIYTYNDVTNKITWTPTLPTNSSLYIRVRHTNANGDSDWSPSVFFQTVGSIPAGGSISLLISGDNNIAKWLIVDCKSEEAVGIKDASGATGNKIYNTTIVNCGTSGMDVDESVEVKNVLIRNNAGSDIDINTGKTVTASNNAIQDSAKTGAGTYTSGTSDFSKPNPFFWASSDISPNCSIGRPSSFSFLVSSVISFPLTISPCL